MMWALASKCTTLWSSGIDSSVTDSPSKNLRHYFFYRIALFNPQRKNVSHCNLVTQVHLPIPTFQLLSYGSRVLTPASKNSMVGCSTDSRIVANALSSQKPRKGFFYTRSTLSVSYFSKPKTLNLPRQIIWPIKMKNSYGFSIWKRRHLENIARPGNTAKCRYGGRHSGTQLIPGLYCKSGTSLVAMFWAFNLFRFDLVNVRELPKSLSTTWTLFTSKTQENFVTDRLPTKERKLAKYDRLYNTKTFSRKTCLSSLKPVNEISWNIFNMLIGSLK